MNICNLSIEDMPGIVAFNYDMFPEKVIPHEAYLKFWFSRNKEAIRQCLILRDDNGVIHGQVLVSEMSFFFNNERINSVWGFDLIVSEECRRAAWGVDLLLAYMEQHPLSFATGVGPAALPIQLKMGNKVLGELRKYVGVISSFSFFLSLFKKKKSQSKFPHSVNAQGRTYTIVNKEELPNKTEPYNNTLFEVCRDRQFLEWRYFNELHDYYFYKDTQSDDFFVVRITKMKSFWVIILVDYRCSLDNADSFERIFSAVKTIMKTVGIGLLIVGSSHSTVDLVMNNHHFISVGRPRPILGVLRGRNLQERISSRTFVFVTFADSDGETNWI